MKENVFEDVDISQIGVGDVVHVHWQDQGRGELYLEQQITEVSPTQVATPKYVFLQCVCRFYLVSKAKKPLPTELGAVVEHTDGWKFVRVGEDDWIGISPRSGRSTMHWRDYEVDSSSRKAEA